MTFEEFFKANHKDVPGIDRNTQALVRLAARTAFANCWNTAIDEAARWIAAPGDSSEEAQLMARALKVSK